VGWGEGLRRVEERCGVEGKSWGETRTGRESCKDGSETYLVVKMGLGRLLLQRRVWDESRCKDGSGIVFAAALFLAWLCFELASF
jgi:hypothetical protein